MACISTVTPGRVTRGNDTDSFKNGEELSRIVTYFCFHDVDVVPKGRHFDFDYRAAKPCNHINK